MISRILDGKYKVESLISSGGMANVYAAIRLQIGDRVAVKILKKDGNLNPVSLKRFQLEASSAASINHQNIVRIFDFGILDDIAYLVMELLEGPSLFREISNLGTIPIKRSVKLFQQICAAVHAAHTQGIIHRDLKPSNVIFQHANCDDDLIKVVDFGIAKLINQNREGEKLTEEGSTMGTPEYMSPEQCLGHKVSARSDIYSLGIMLYEMLTGRVPFSDAAISAVMVQHTFEKPVKPSRYNTEISTELENVIMKALEKSPEARYRTPIEMATEYEMAWHSVSARRAAISLSYVEEIAKAEGAGELLGTDIVKRAPLRFDTGLAPITRDQETGPTRDIRSLKYRFSFENFLGRQEEFQRLTNHFERVREGYCEVVLISGDVGIGKTELVNQFHSQFKTDALFLNPRFYEYEAKSLLSDYLDGIYSFVRMYKTQNLAEHLSTLPEELIAEIDDHLTEITGLIKVDLERYPANEEQFKYQIFERLSQIYLKLSLAIPVVLFLDDLHWADQFSLDFLSYLVRNADNSRLMVIGTLHNKELLDEKNIIKSWLRRLGQFCQYDQIKLNALSELEVRNLIEAIFGIIVIPESTIKTLVQTSEGNPLYLGEILRQLLQEQQITWKKDCWYCTNLKDFQIPATMLDIFEMRLAKLPEEALELFSYAAILGEKFSFKILYELSDITKKILEEIIDIGLNQFIIKEFTATNGNFDEVFIFYHGTLRRALYHRLSNYKRRRLHARIGDKLEALPAQNADRRIGDLAYHFHYGGNSPKAFHYSLKAGDAAYNIFAIEEALKYYGWAEEALGLVGGNSDSRQELIRIVGFYLSYGSVLMHLGRNDDAKKQFDLGLEIAQEHNLIVQQGKLLGALGDLTRSCGNYLAAIEICQAAIKLLHEMPETDAESRILRITGDAYFSQGMIEQALDYYNNSLKLARETGNRAGEGKALRCLGMLFGQQSQAKLALAYLTQALEIACEVDDRQTEFFALMFMGNIYLEQEGDLPRAADCYLRSKAIARAIDRRRGECRISLNMGELYRKQSEFLTAATYFNEAKLIAAEIQDRESEGHALSNLGLVFQSLGDSTRSMEAFQNALNIFEEINYRSDAQVEALAGIANNLWQQDRVPESRDYYLKAVAAGQKLGLWHQVVPALRCLAACEKVLGEITQARQHIQAAIKTLQSVISTELSEAEYKQCLKIESELNGELALLGQEK